jgi:hypothetical protein
LNWRPDPAAAKAKPGAKAAKSIQVEVTRTLTAKSGNITLSVLDAKGNQVAQQQVKISCVQCSDKGDK